MHEIKRHRVAGPRNGPLPGERRYKGGGGSQTTTTTQKTEPWADQQPFLKYGFQQAQDIYKGQKPEYFPGQTVTPFNAYQQAANTMGGQRAMSGSPLLPAAQNQTMATLRGDYLTPGNPYVTGLTESINAAIRPQIDSRFSGSGRYGSAGMAEATASGIANALAPQLFNQYNQERQNMLGAAQAAPGLAQADYNDINALSSIGLTQQQQAQNELNSQIERFNFGQNVDANKLAQYMGLIGGNFGGTGTSTNVGPSPGKGGNALGTAFQGLGAIGSAAGGIGQAYTAFSDRRLKTGVTRIGTTNGGLPVYRFRYVWGGPERFGVMADEAEAKYPSAVHRDQSGYLMVDYSRIG